MTKHTLDARSNIKLLGVHPKMRAVVELAYAIYVEEFKLAGFSVICGVRTEAEQIELYAQGRTKPGAKVTWTLKSNHFKNPRTGFGHAVDLFPGNWTDLTLFNKMALAMFKAAKILNTPIRWGADWDRDGNPRERGETDSTHFELWGI
jgi:peptidoglycan LD-endopeptidase CwlK